MKSLSENLRLAFIKQLTCVRLQFFFSHVVVSLTTVQGFCFVK